MTPWAKRRERRRLEREAERERLRLELDRLAEESFDKFVAARARKRDQRHARLVEAESRGQLALANEFWLLGEHNNATFVLLRYLTEREEEERSAHDTDQPEGQG